MFMLEDNIGKMAVLPKVSRKFNAIPIKIPTIFFSEMEKPILQFIWNFRRTKKTLNNLEKEEQSRRTHTSQFQNLLQSYSNENSVVWDKDRCIDQQRVEINPYIYGQFILTSVQNYSMEKE